MNSIILTVEAVEAAEVKEKFASFSGKFKFGYGDKTTEDYIAVIGFNGNIEKFKTVKAEEHYLVTGQIISEEYESPLGTKQKKFKLIANTIQPCGNDLTVNQVTIAGNQGQDPDVKYFESGKVTSAFTLAVKDIKGGTHWFNIKSWGKTAEVVANYARKGSCIGVSGELQIEHWNDRNTDEARFKFVVIADRVSLLGKSGESKPAVADDDDF